MNVPNLRKNGASITVMMTKPARPPIIRHSASKPMRKNTPVIATMPVAPNGGDADAEPGIARRHATPGGEEFQRLLRRHAQPDGRVEHQRAEQHPPAQHRIGGTELLEDEQQQHQSGERAGEDAEVGSEPRVDEAGA